ncbi:CPBP family intramembrane metalloprotease [Trueperella pyogenes]|uniref:CPBP family intramembrane glutamic endopeptidase n=1 Tax=Trueperella pyogenes TaxID=1661 RepID=UPI0032464C2E
MLSRQHNRQNKNWGARRDTPECVSVSDVDKEIAIKKPIVLVVFYVVVMAAGLFYLNYFKGVKYSDPTFTQHFVWIVLGLAVCALLYYLAFRHETVLPNRGRSWGAYLLAVVPVGIAVIATMFAVPLTSVLLTTVLSALLVGIGEEIVFRHVFFGALLRQSAAKGKTMTAAILTSALVFSVVHAVNILDGQSVSRVITQLGPIFLLGILFAGLYLQTRSILSLIVLHWLWDSLALIAPTVSFLTPILAVLTFWQVAIGIVLLWRNRSVKAG